MLEIAYKWGKPLALAPELVGVLLFLMTLELKIFCCLICSFAYMYRLVKSISSWVAFEGDRSLYFSFIAA